MTRFPWEQEPQPPFAPLEDRFERLRRDVTTMVTHTAVMVCATHESLDGIVANVPRNEIVPSGKAKYTGGNTVEFQNIGMPQPGHPFMTLRELLQTVHHKAAELGWEFDV